MTQRPIQMWKLNSPSMCRDFLKQVRIGPRGAAITELTQADGKVLTIDEASDEQVTQVANELAEAMAVAQKGRHNPLT